MKQKILISIIISIAMYLVLSFVKFDILWIKELPSYSYWDRGFMCFFWIMAQTLFHLLYEENNLNER